MKKAWRITGIILIIVAMIASIGYLLVFNGTEHENTAKMISRSVIILLSIFCVVTALLSTNKQSSKK
ncbi:MAG: hypothetical protein E7413_02395 [Ruminococcaceae bacterium]|nr:hypothetical protein [Oscillospiraceae bacterium]